MTKNSIEFSTQINRRSNTSWCRIRKTTALCFKITQLTVGTNTQLNCGEFKDFDFPPTFLDFLDSQTDWIQRTISHKTKTFISIDGSQSPPIIRERSFSKSFNRTRISVTTWNQNHHYRIVATRSQSRKFLSSGQESKFYKTCCVRVCVRQWVLKEVVFLVFETVASSTNSLSPPAVAKIRKSLHDLPLKLYLLYSLNTWNLTILTAFFEPDKKKRNIFQHFQIVLF